MTERRPARALGIQHLVLNVRDIEASHRFYTEGLGFEQCGELSPETAPMTMRFYRTTPDHHHDLALVQMRKPDEAPAPEKFSMLGRFNAINHFAVAYPDRDSWLQQLEYMQSQGVKFEVRGEHGMTHSAYVADPDGNGIEILYDMPAEVWEGDVNAALNYFKPLPTEGEAALVDDADYVRF